MSSSRDAFPEYNRLIELVALLRGPHGCPWDREQTRQSLRMCLLEEAYEYLDALDAADSAHACEELGDLLLQVVLNARIAADCDEFTIEDVARGINEKLVRRHPHVFGDAHAATSTEVLRSWDSIKQRERDTTGKKGALDGVPPGLPALMRAEKIQRRAARVGFDWDNLDPVLAKVEEEFAEFRQAIGAGNHLHAAQELGDILFALVNVARHCAISAEESLQGTIRKFERRFRYVEQALEQQGSDTATATLEEMDRYWEESKKHIG